MKRLVFTVTNDLNYDQRMDRICSALAEHGYDVTLVGRKLNQSKPFHSETYSYKRLPCWFEKGKLFYLEYNFRLFCFLLLRRFDILCSIDLDTILPGYFIARLKQKKLVYDAHEYFSEMEEIVSRPLIHGAWKMVERFTMRRVKNAYTISDGYAKLFMENYEKEFKVIRNVPRMSSHVSRTPSNKKIIQYQGILNVGRGLEESIEAISNLEGFTLRIFGDGPLMSELKNLTQSLNAESKVEFMGMTAPKKLRNSTSEAWIGLTLFSETGLHHRHSLANRFFDYLHAGIPQIAMDYPEYANFNHSHEIALLIPKLTADEIEKAILKLDQNKPLYASLSENCAEAAKQNSWEVESKKLIEFYNTL